MYSSVQTESLTYSIIFTGPTETELTAKDDCMYLLKYLEIYC